MTIIQGRFSKRAIFSGFFLLALSKEVRGRKYAIVNSETIGFGKIINWTEGDYFSIPVKYRIGPEAIIIKEIC